MSRKDDNPCQSKPKQPKRLYAKTRGETAVTCPIAAAITAVRQQAAQPAQASAIALLDNEAAIKAARDLMGVAASREREEPLLPVPSALVPPQL
jgi:hypothetical protein